MNQKLVEDKRKYFRALDQCRKIFDEKSSFKDGSHQYVSDYYVPALRRFTLVHREGTLMKKFSSYQGVDFDKDERDLIFEDRNNTTLEAVFAKMYEDSKRDKATYDAMLSLSIQFCGESIPVSLVKFTRDVLSGNSKRPRKIEVGGDQFVRDLMLSLFVFGLSEALGINPTANDSRFDGTDAEELVTGCGLVADWSKERFADRERRVSNYASMKKIWNKKLLHLTGEKDGNLAKEIARHILVVYESDIV